MIEYQTIRLSRNIELDFGAVIDKFRQLTIFMIYFGKVQFLPH